MKLNAITFNSFHR